MSTTEITKLLVDIEKVFTDDEVVTNARLSKVTLPSGKVLGLVTLDNGLDHTRPNTFGPKGLVELNTAYDAALADDTIDAIAVTGKPFILAAGADLNTFKQAPTEGVRTIAELGHAVFRKLADGGKPSFGFINGLALGGGLEVALHADYRTVIDSVPAVGLPEVMLGLVPGWGGAWLLPNLIGPEKAAKVFIQNPLNNGTVLRSGAEVVELGIADVSFNGADYLEQSLLWADKVLTGEVTVERPSIDRGAGWDEAVKNAGFFAWAKTGDKSPAAKKAVELLALAKTASKDEGFAAEDEALTTAVSQPETLASLYSFDLVQKRAKRPAGAPDKSLAQPITKVGIIGAGLMASQFALLFVQRLKVPVVLVDLDQERADKGVAYVHAELDKRLAKGKSDQDRTNRLKALVSATTDYSVAFSDADFIIEAVFEEMSVKKTVFANAEKVAPATAVFATNTSSLSITEMAADLEHPERVVGFHFFNPVAVMPLLEIIRGQKTGDAALATAFAAGKGLGKTTILVKDSPSFIVNRLLGRFMGEVAKIADEGTPIPVVDQAFAGVTPMPPYQLIALVGPAIAYHNNETLAQAFPERFYLSENLHKVVEAKKGSFYGPDGKTLDPEVEALLTVGDKQLTAEQVRRQTLEALADETRRMLDEGVAAAPEDIDLGMITGAGFQFWNGGLTQLLDREGISEAVTGKKFH
ncbi:3-hydroxyacyl-CoA dehydrogenase NAD-binding domain-containing protein [Nocardioides sp. Kera G14]|uniref:3-hydroxyacyl-CoA dehydrogenase NAD-binding domain-containing protein n=1 Tax=Nocardioides sp. Kera G14 TaxID=2884264 RepID=UPI001D101894|nr:3-hydroxyacyl-CoA dehydrogenase NAD-binding domain-containing protein [Nocardioides sp. Kera G14]UDY22334.1 enoyl-CoA hydratase/isomerase family protein [Nocardioides sp. Kera G14]